MWVKQFNDALFEINQYVYFKINNNFHVFYDMVHDFNTFELKTNSLLEDISRIKGNFERTKAVAVKEIQSLQDKITKKNKLSRLLKLLETIKYIDKANTTIKTLLDKTNYKKISELLVVLNSNFNQKMTEIKIFDNKFEQIVQLKNKFFKQLITIAINKFNSSLDSANDIFTNYIEEFEEDKVFNLDININDTNEINSIILELRLFNKDSVLYKQLIQQIQLKLGKFNRTLNKKIAKMIIFKEPSLSLLNSYRNYINHIYSVYQVTVPVEDNKDTYSLFLQTLTKHANVFIRETLAVFNLEQIDLSQIKEFLAVIGSFEKFSCPETQSDNLFENIQVYFKKIVLNARQCNILVKIKDAMEEEEWKGSNIPSAVEHVIKGTITKGEISVFSQYIIWDEAKFMFSRSFFVFLLYLNELEVLNAELEDLQVIFEQKLKDIVDVYLKNCEILILKGKALKFEKIKKINTKNLSGFIRFVCPSIKVLRRVFKFSLFVKEWQGNCS